MTREELIAAAEKRGEAAAKKGRMRVSPFYEEHAALDGKRVDITSMLDEGWYRGYDSAVVVV